MYCGEGLKGPRGRLGETALPFVAAQGGLIYHCLFTTGSRINAIPTA